MPDPELTAEEEKYFESAGETELPEIVEETVEDVEAAETVEETVEQTVEEETQPKVVPLQALHEAREEAKKLREKLENKDADFNKLTGRLDVLQQLAQKEQPAEEINWDETPIDAGKATTERLDQVEQSLQAQEQERALNATVSAHEAAFRNEHPDYDQALTHLQTARVNELKVFGLDDTAIMNQLKAEARELGATALQTGLNPAEIVYKLAEARGYKMAEDKAEDKAEETPVEPVTPAEKLETIERGQNASKSAASAAAVPPAKNTLETLMTMDDDEFASVADGDWKKLWQ